MSHVQSGSQIDMNMMERFQEIDTRQFNNKEDPGIIYLASVPKGMNVSNIIKVFTEFGKVGRVFLQIDRSVDATTSGKISSKVFSNGWVEFTSKETAKLVAKKLDNSPVGEKRKIKNRDVWNLKFLPKFKWTNLSEKLAENIAVKEKRFRDSFLPPKKRVPETTLLLKSKKRVKFGEASPAAKNATPLLPRKNFSDISKKTHTSSKLKDKIIPLSIRGYPKRNRVKPTRYEAVLYAKVNNNLSKIPLSKKGKRKVGSTKVLKPSIIPVAKSGKKKVVK